MTLKLMQLPGPPCGGESPKRMMATTKCGSAQEGDRGGSHSADALSNLQLGPKPVPREDREQPEVRLVDLHITGLPTHWNVEQYAAQHPASACQASAASEECPAGLKVTASRCMAPE